ncbi:hypothetical protein CC80DRAFT_585563, partial [Byssothecium circinans]
HTRKNHNPHINHNTHITHSRIYTSKLQPPHNPNTHKHIPMNTRYCIDIILILYFVSMSIAIAIMACINCYKFRYVSDDYYLWYVDMPILKKVKATTIDQVVTMMAFITVAGAGMYVPSLVRGVVAQIKYAAHMKCFHAHQAARQRFRGTEEEVLRQAALGVGKFVKMEIEGGLGEVVLI